LGAGLAFILTYVGTKWIDASRRRKRLVDLAPLLCAELADLQLRFLDTAFWVAARLHTMDAEFLKWYCEAYQANHSPLKQNAELKLAVLLRDDANVLNYYLRHTRKRYPPGSGMQFVPYEAPLLGHHLATIEGLKPKVHARLIDVDVNLQMYRHDVERIAKDHALTFTTTGINHDLATANVRIGWESLLKRAKLLVDKITVAVREIEQSLLV
jgi:hypothetical protein